jgi:thiamine pyrophosphokinase
LNRAIVFANGDINDGDMVRRVMLFSGESLLVAADGGARHADRFGVRLDAVIGDMDSIEDQALAALDDGGAQIIRHPAEKDETDLELALKWAVERGATWLRVIGAVGGRLDQTLSNIYLLALPDLNGVDARIVASREETLLARPGWTFIEGQQGDTVSLLPLNGTVFGVKTEGLHYPLRNEDLYFGPARGVSNVMTHDKAVVYVRSGILLVVHTIGQA